MNRLQSTVNAKREENGGMKEEKEEEMHHFSSFPVDRWTVKDSYPPHEFIPWETVEQSGKKYKSSYCRFHLKPPQGLPM